jgi:hypothetical protein
MDNCYSRTGNILSEHPESFTKCRVVSMRNEHTREQGHDYEHLTRYTSAPRGSHAGYDYGITDRDYSERRSGGGHSRSRSDGAGLAPAGYDQFGYHIDPALADL